MQFKPISDDHAVESVVFTFVSSRFIDIDDIQALVNAHDRFRADLPALNLPNSDAPVVEFAYRRPDGSASWLLRCGNGGEFTVECRRYTRWDRVWKVVRAVVGIAVDVCNAVRPLSILAPSLRVVDRFRSTSDETHLDSLLRRDAFIAEAAFNTGPLFHSNVGWFEDLENVVVLNTLNVQGRRDSLFEPTKGKTSQANYVVIDHVQQIRLTEPPQAYTAFDDEHSPVVVAVNELHQRNKKLLARILVNEMQDAIGLGK